MSEPIPPLPAPWREWVAENLMRGAPVEQLRGALLAQGFGAPAVDAELAEAAGHPWIRAGRRLGRAVVKREWQMATRAELARLGPATSIPRLPLPPLAEFLSTSYASNTPAIFTGAVDHWPALKRWSLDHLRALAGEVPMEVQVGRETDPLFDLHHDQHKATLSLKELCDRIEAGGPSNDVYLTARNAAANAPRLGALWEELGDLGDGYLDFESPWFRPHLWLGPAGTETPLHHDLSNILFAQIRGEKRFTLIPPDQTPWVYNFYTVYSAVDPERPDLSRYPDYAKVTPVSFVIRPGEVLFIPVGWWHSVVALSPSISVGFVHLKAPNEWHHSYTRLTAGEAAP